MGIEEFLDRYCHVVTMVWPFLNVLALIRIIATDQLFASHLALVLALCIWTFAICFFLVLSKFCVLRRKSLAKNYEVEHLFDTHLEINDEMDELPCDKLTVCSLCNLFRNPYKFSLFRPAYGVVLFTAFASLVGVHLVKLSGAWFEQDDADSAYMELIFPALLLILPICILANFGLYEEEKEQDFYQPFEHFVQIPMKVMVGKTVASFLTSGGVHFIVTLTILILSLLGIFSSNYLYYASEETIRSLFPNMAPKQRSFFCFVLLSSALSCVVLLFGMVLSSWAKVKRNVLGAIEKNWERNMVAIEFLLRDMELESLQQVKQALFQKRVQHLTREEFTAFEYIVVPIWITKRPFEGRWFPAELRANPAAPEEQQVAEQIGDVAEVPRVAEQIGADVAEQIGADVAEQIGAGAAEVARVAEQIGAEIAEVARNAEQIGAEAARVAQVAEQIGAEVAEDALVGEQIGAEEALVAEEIGAEDAQAAAAAPVEQSTSGRMQTRSTTRREAAQRESEGSTSAMNPGVPQKRNRRLTSEIHDISDFRG